MKKGFTLIELLSVIILLGLLSLIVIPVVDKIIKENKEQAYQTNIKMIEEGARGWAAENTFNLPSENGEYVDLTICELEYSGKIEIDVRNPAYIHNYLMLRSEGLIVHPASSTF